VIHMKNRNKIIKRIMVTAVIFGTLLLLCACTSEPREVRTMRINEKGELIIVFTDGTESNVGMVKGEKGDSGNDGKDGADGKDGLNGTDGKDGETGETGLRGPAGQNGRSVSNATINDEGQLTITYSDGTTSQTSLNGKLYLFGGKCGESAQWGFYNGGVLAIWGEGTAESYSAESPAPWAMLIPMLSAVVIDKTDLTVSEGLLHGVDQNSVTVQWIEQYEISYIDMVDKAPVYDSSELENKLAGVNDIPVCTEIHIVEKTETYAKIILEGGGYGYIDIDHVRVGSAASMIYEAPVGFDYIKPKDGGMALRTFPDATGGRTDNIRTTITNSDFEEDGRLFGQDGVLCKGVSQNGWWYRVSYNGELLYVMYTVVQPVMKSAT